MGIDLLSASAHKICGPKGVGFLYVRRRNPHVRLEPLLEGGGHERGLRSGTLNVPGIVGLGAAAELARPSESRKFRALRDRLEKALQSRLEGVRIHGNPERRLANTSSLGFDGVDGEELIRRLEGICVSSSSACTSARLQPSYVLGAMGLDEDRIRESVRFSLGRFTTEEEIDRTADRVVDAVATLRKTAGKEKR
jgi:cysteine desulfurase